MTNEYVLSRILRKLLSDAEKKAITTCANLGLGNNRDLTGIRGVASSVRADPQVVAAAFLFLPVLGNRDEYVDVPDVAPAAIDTAVLPDHTDHCRLCPWATCTRPGGFVPNDGR